MRKKRLWPWIFDLTVLCFGALPPPPHDEHSPERMPPFPLIKFNRN